MGAGLFMGSTPINGVRVGTFSKGGIIPSGTISITSNGNYDVTQYANANVSVSGTGIDTSDATLTSGGQMLEGIIAYGKNGKVEGTIPSKGAASITPSETAQEIAAGQYLSGEQTIKAIPSTYVGSGVTRQDAKTITPSESIQVAVDAGIYTDGVIQVNAIPTNYVGSAITRQAAKTIIPSTSEQTATQAGVYTTGAIKVSAMPTGALSTPVVDSDGLVTAQVGTSGYLVSGTEKTLQLTIQAAKTVTPSESEQVAVEAGVYTTGQVEVGAISSSYVGSAVTRQAAKTVTPSTNEQTAVQTGVYTTGDIKIAAIQTETKDITSNGTYTPTSGKFFSSVNVNVSSAEFSTQSKSIIPNETEQIITPDSGYDGLSSVTVGAISSTYVGSGVTKQAAKTVAPSTSEQTIISAGVYTTGEIKMSAMPTGTLNAPTVDSAGLVTSQVGTGGYLSSGTKTTLQLTVQATKTISPSESEQIAVESNVFTTGQIKVSAVSSSYIGSAITKKSSATYTPGTTNQIISSGQYLSGTQTILGDANLVSSNILSGVSIFGVSGSVVMQKYYTGTSTPSSSLGNDGDLYFKE